MMKTYSVISSVLLSQPLRIPFVFLWGGPVMAQEIHAPYLECVISATAEPQTAKARSSLKYT